MPTYLKKLVHICRMLMNKSFKAKILLSSLLIFFIQVSKSDCQIPNHDFETVLADGHLSNLGNVRFQ